MLSRKNLKQTLPGLHRALNCTDRTGDHLVLKFTTHNITRGITHLNRSCYKVNSPLYILFYFIFF